MNEKRDNIYIYLWEELNTIYIGRTINPKSRHYQHRHIPTEKTYKFSSEHGVEHPKMIIIESGLTVVEGTQREEYWINEYRKNSPYDVLNKLKGGQVGNLSKLTEEERKERKKIWEEKHKNDIIEYKKQYYKNNKCRIDENHKKYHDEHIDDILEWQKQYRQDHKEKLKEYKRNYYITHKKEISEKKKKQYQEKKEEINKRNKKWVETHKEEVNKIYKKYRETHREEIRERGRKYYKEHKKTS